MQKKKNKGAVNLGRLSAKARKKKLGAKAFREAMKAIRAKGRQIGDKPWDVANKPRHDYPQSSL